MPIARFEMPDGRVARFEVAEGTTPEQAQREIETLISQQSGDPSFIDQVAGVGEVIGTIASSAIAEPAAGIAGLGTLALTQDPAAAAAVTKGVRGQLTYDPMTTEGRKNLESIAGSEVVQGLTNAIQTAEQFTGDIGYDIAGPVGGAIGSAIPAAIGEAVGLTAPIAVSKGLSKVGGRFQRQADSFETPQVDATNQQLNAEQGDLPFATEEGMAQTGQTLKKGSTEQIALDVNPDPGFYKASDELGINTEPLASFASQNPQYRAIEQGLASFPASQLDMQSKAYIADVSQAADDLITRYGGTLDKAELSARFQEDSLRTIDDIYDAESQLYDAIDLALPGQTRVKPTNILSFIESKIAKSGGIKAFAKQNPRLMKMYNQLKPKSGGKAKMDLVGMTGSKAPPQVQPTYEVLNDIRREVGQQLGRKGDTTFKNTETGLLKAVYGRLKEDQNSVARTLDNGEELLKTADAHTIQRKQLEDNLTTLLGKNLQKELMPVLGKSIKGLAPATGRVDAKTFKNTIEAIPKKFRGEAVVSALNDIFRGTAVGGQAFDATQFTKFMNQLDRSPESKALLYKSLPDGAADSLENIRKVARGISLAQGDRVTTGRIAAIFDENDGLLKKLMKSGVSMAAAKMAGPLAGMGVGELLKNASDAAKSTNSLLASPAFQATIRNAVKEGVVDGSQISANLARQEAALAKSKAFKDWAKTLNESDAVKLTNIGLIGYLLSDEQESN